MHRKPGKLLIASALTSLVCACGGGDPDISTVTASPSVPPSGNQPTNPASPAIPALFPVAVGQVGPVAADNPRQQPFACATQTINSLGKPQPVPDNQQGIGMPVTDANGKVIGYSADCGLPTRVDYFYRSTSDVGRVNMHPYDPTNPATDVATINVGGKPVNYIVRFERGTINRFLYSIAVLTPNPDAAHPNNVDLSVWNKDLVFTLQGATGVGHSQATGGGATEGIENPNGGADNNGSGTMMPYLLEQGYAVAFSSGTATSTTYNLQLTGQTASMVKQQFSAAYAKPRFTFAVGESGGAVQQLAYAQNYPGLLDGAIPVQVFPDMVTQTFPVGDCELLTYYFDKVDAQVNGSPSPGTVDSNWTSWAKRSWITGFSGNDTYSSLQSGPTTNYKPTSTILASAPFKASTAGATNPGGSDVCMQQWRGAVPAFMDPYWGQIYPSQVGGNLNVLGSQGLASTFWGYVNDLISVFTGSPTAKPVANPPNIFDNEGVQYGLAALRAGNILPDEFLNLNAHVGGWVRPENFLPEGYPYTSHSGNVNAPDGADVGNTDPWSARNATAIAHLSPTDIAPRTVASASDLSAMQNAYKSGMVFRGNVNLPIINIEPYNEQFLDEHASKEPFVTRQRLIAAKGNADNQAIWMLNPGPYGLSYKWNQMAPFVFQALQYETTWLLSGSRPAALQDACYDGNSNVIASGPGVWDGQIAANGQLLADTTNGGACTKAYPVKSNPRMAAGAPASGSVFKCALKPVITALHDGTYGSTFFTVAQEQRLEQIFSTGVCDYSKPDQALPAGS